MVEYGTSIILIYDAIYFNNFLDDHLVYYFNINIALLYNTLAIALINIIYIYIIINKMYYFTTIAWIATAIYSSSFPFFAKTLN